MAGINDKVTAVDTLVAENIFVSAGGKNIVAGATIRAERGTITGLLGRNGCGKSTMLKAIFGTGRADECDVFLNDSKVKKPYRQTDLLHYLPQQSFLPPGLRPRQILKQFGVSISEVIRLFPETEPDLDLPVSSLSGGKERLFAVLALLLGSSRFLLLDEPFSHIMPLHIARLQDLLLQQKEYKGIVITDHMYRPLLAVCDRIYLMKEGKSIFIKDHDDLVLHGYLSSLGAV